MKKRILSAILGIAMIVSCVGCGGGNDSTVDTDPDYETDKFNVTVACQVEEGETIVMAALEKAYEAANPDVNIIVKDFGGYNLVTDYITAYASTPEQLPMVIWMDDTYFAEPAEGGYFLDLREYYEASEETSYDLYYDSMLHAAAYNGEYKPLSEDDSPEYGLYFAPRDYNKPTIVYNKKLMADLGVTIPDTSNGWSMDEFYDFLHTVNDAIHEKAGENRSYRGYRVIRLFSSWQPVWTTLFENLGTDGIINGTELNLNSAKNTEILDELYNEIYGYGVDESKNYMIDTEDNFNTGTTCMTVVSRPIVVGQANQLGADSIDFLPFPGEKVAVGCSGYGITTVHADEEQTVNGETKKVADLAWDFIKFIISEEGQQAAGETGLSIPVLKSLLEDGSWTEWNAEQNLNHAAFLSGEDLKMTTLNHLEPYKRIKAREMINGFFSANEIGEQGSKENRQERLDELVKNFGTHIGN